MRFDHDLAFMLRYENIAWYDEEKALVRILDRRIYPIRTEFVNCHSHGEVAEAIAKMVTQSYGPYTAAAMGMALAARECAGQSRDRQMAHLQAAASCLASARPTTARQMQRITQRALEAASHALDAGEGHLDRRLFELAVEALEEKYRSIERQGKELVSFFPARGRVMTQCFADTVIGMMLRACRAEGKEIEFFCPETRPFYQGSRLTASVICDMGFPVTVICDNMPAFTLEHKGIDLFTSASDVITLDGHIINKVGTFQIALAASHFGIPYYCTGNPDRDHPDLSTIVIEERKPEEVLESMGQRLVMDGVQAYYPAFDITPPELCRAIVTTRGSFAPKKVADFFQSSVD